MKCRRPRCGHAACPAHLIAILQLLTLCSSINPPQVRIEHNGDHPGLRYVLENDALLVTLFDG